MRSQLILLVRHGETEWSLDGRHTGVSDIPLTENGRAMAKRVGRVVNYLTSIDTTLAAVLTSPLDRARRTCELAGLGERAEVDPDLREWDYGEYEGLTPAQIRAMAPGWMLFTHGCPGGESPEQIGARVDRVIGRVRAIAGNVALFAHGHVFRVLAARWIGSPAEAGRHFLLDTATVSVLGYYRDVPAIKRWNAPIDLPR